jgi:phosphatidylserine/phosphatidylglycerophosphate/cardiolipin synthase-like enzyme
MAWLLVTGEAILKTLARKAKRGVNVCLLMDGLGSFRISSQFLAEFKQAGGKYAFFMPMVHWPFRGRANLRNHRKMVIVDGRMAMLGGLNLANEYMGPSVDIKRWRDLSVLVTGPILDDVLGIIGSMNMDMRSFFLNYEVAMFIHSEPFVRQLEAWSSNIMRECGIGVKKASAPVEYLEDIGRLFASLL